MYQEAERPNLDRGGCNYSEKDCKLYFDILKYIIYHGTTGVEWCD